MKLFRYFVVRRQSQSIDRLTLYPEA